LSGFILRKKRKVKGEEGRFRPRSAKEKRPSRKKKVYAPKRKRYRCDRTTPEQPRRGAIPGNRKARRSSLPDCRRQSGAAKRPGARPKEKGSDRRSIKKSPERKDPVEGQETHSLYKKKRGYCIESDGVKIRKKKGTPSV